MQYELYLDVLFLENLLVDYLLLSLLKEILKSPAGRLRRLLGAALGSMGVCGLYLLQSLRTGNQVPPLRRIAVGAQKRYAGMPLLRVQPAPSCRMP